MFARITSRIILVLLLAAGSCVAQESEFKTKVFDFPAKNGKPAHRTEVTYRGNTHILFLLSEKGSSGDYVPYSRSYFAGHTMVVEVDEDRDGFFETIIVHEDSRKPTAIEAFTRSRDGTAQPIEHEKLEKIKRDSEEMAKRWEKLLPPKDSAH
jgi:hypothetical protein